MVRADGEFGPPGQILDQRLNWTVTEFDDRGAPAAHEMVSVPWLSDHIRRKAPRLEQSMDDIDRGQNLECPVDRSPADVGKKMDNLLGGEGPLLVQNDLDDLAPWQGGAITESGEPVEHVSGTWS